MKKIWIILFLSFGSLTVTAQTINLSSTRSYEARIDSSMRISDPLILAFKDRANGATGTNTMDLLNVPSGTYGFANGRLILYKQGASSSGTFSGMGNVGTGTSTAGPGSYGAPFHVNGKSPFEGHGPYGARYTVPIIPEQRRN